MGFTRRNRIPILIFILVMFLLYYLAWSVGDFEIAVSAFIFAPALFSLATLYQEKKGEFSLDDKAIMRLWTLYDLIFTGYGAIAGLVFLVGILMA